MTDWQPIKKKAAPSSGEDYVLVYSSETGAIGVGYHSDLGEWTHALDGAATHWMPLPEPPETGLFDK